MPKSRVLITGALGFIGRHCLAGLVESKYDVHAAELCPIKNVNSRAKWHQVDLLNERQTRELMRSVKATHLLHFAWYVEPGKYWHSEENVQWVEAGKTLLREFYSNGGRRAILAGTCAEYDWQLPGPYFENLTPLVPATVYGKCKHSLRVVLENFSGETGLSSAWGRIFFLYGPQEHPSRLVPSVITSILKGNPALCSHGNQIRDFLYVKDVALAFITLLESEVQGAVNIASGQPLTLKEMVRKIGDKLGHPELIRIGEIPAPQDVPPLLVADVNRLKQEVGWVPEYDLDSGLDETIEWWKENLQKTGVRI